MLACIKETFRRYPPVPGSMPRVVPKGGATVAGHFVPEGTIVSVAQLPMYHSARNFSQPFSFQPERFLQPERFPDDKPGAIQPFGIGPRDCVGKKWVPCLFTFFPGCLEWGVPNCSQLRNRCTSY